MAINEDAARRACIARWRRVAKEERRKLRELLAAVKVHTDAAHAGELDTWQARLDCAALVDALRNVDQAESTVNRTIAGRYREW